MQKEYFLVALNHNESSDPFKIDGVIYNEEYDLPIEFEEAKKIASYDSVYVLAVKSLFALKDVITGEVLTFCSDGNIDCLSYYRAKIAKSEDIIKITNIYKNKIEEIKNRSFTIYYNNQLKLKEQLIEENNARDFLSSLESINI